MFVCCYSAFIFIQIIVDIDIHSQLQISPYDDNEGYLLKWGGDGYGGCDRLTCVPYSIQVTVRLQ